MIGGLSARDGQTPEKVSGQFLEGAGDGAPAVVGRSRVVGFAACGKSDEHRVSDIVHDAMRALGCSHWLFAFQSSVVEVFGGKFVTEMLRKTRLKLSIFFAALVAWP